MALSRVAFGDESDMAVVELNSKSIYEKVIDRIWRAVCVRMMVSHATALRAGQSIRFGEILVHDEWCEVPLRKLASTQRVKAPWSDTKVWSSNGSFVVDCNLIRRLMGPCHTKMSTMRTCWKA